jgi:regulator of protease activity HflC (stomatin/prohibitin superfamily)
MRGNIVSVIVLVVPIVLGGLATIATGNPFWIIGGAAIGLLAAQSPKVSRQWERAIVLRLGKYVGMRGPGLFWIVPLVDTVQVYIDQRVMTTGFAAEQTLTADTVPVNVDAVLFWMVHDPEKAALEVQSYYNTVSWAAQTALRDIIGRTWGVTVQSVEMRDIVIPASLQDAMSREAQATREKQARVILGQAEMEIASSFAKAAEQYRDNPTALHLRAMNMLYEGLKEKGALMLVPSSAVESMGMGGMMGSAALMQQRLTTSGTSGDVK